MHAGPPPLSGLKDKQCVVASCILPSLADRASSHDSALIDLGEDVAAWTSRNDDSSGNE